MAFLEHEYINPAEKPVIVFFDTETSGFEADCDVLQIAMKCGSSEFNMYIKPTKWIPPQASAIHKLTNVNGELYYDNTTKLPTKTKCEVLLQMILYLRKLNARCILVGHNCDRFDSPRLIRLIREACMESEFRSVIAGFTDTLRMLRDKYPDRRSQGQLKLGTLADELSISSENAHCASYDVMMLEKIAFHHYMPEELAIDSKSFDQELARHVQFEKNKIIKNTFTSMIRAKVVSDAMITRIAEDGITFDDLLMTYCLDGEEEAIALLEKRENGEPQLIKTEKVLNAILDYLRQYEPL